MVTISNLYNVEHSIVNIFKSHSNYLLYNDMSSNIVSKNLVPTLNINDSIAQVYFTNISGSCDVLNKSFYTTCFFPLARYIFLRKHYFFSFNFYWTKITFKGKGFRVRFFTKKKKFIFNFGHSHWTRLVLTSNNWTVFRMRRAVFILLALRKENFYTLCQTLRTVRLVNRYTKRGLRLRKQIVIKRFGKISQVVSSLQA